MLRLLQLAYLPLIDLLIILFFFCFPHFHLHQANFCDHDLQFVFSNCCCRSGQNYSQTSYDNTSGVTNKFSRLDVGQDVASNAQAPGEPVLSVPDCKCGMPLCICVAPTPEPVPVQVGNFRR